MTSQALSAEPISESRLAEIQARYQAEGRTWLKMTLWTHEVGGLLATIDARDREIAAKTAALAEARERIERLLRSHDFAYAKIHAYEKENRLRVTDGDD